MEVKRLKPEIKVRFRELENIKIPDLRTIDSKYIIKALEAKLEKIKGK